MVGTTERDSPHALPLTPWLGDGDMTFQTRPYQPKKSFGTANFGYMHEYVPL